MSKRTKSGEGGDPVVPTKKSRSDPDPYFTRGKGGATKLTFPATPEYFISVPMINFGYCIPRQIVHKWGYELHIYLLFWFDGNIFKTKQRYCSVHESKL